MDSVPAYILSEEHLRTQRGFILWAVDMLPMRSLVE